MTRDGSGLPTDARTPEPADRRKHDRASPAATAVVWTVAGGPMHYLVENLSIGGALLTGGPLLADDDPIRLTLQLERRNVGPVGAVVLRQTKSHESVVAVAFRGLSVVEEDAIQQALLEDLEAQVEGGVFRCKALVVDPSPHTRQTLLRDLASIGHHAVSASTPLDAMMRLADPAAHFDVVLVDLGVGSVDGLALLRYLAEHHPTTRRILMSGQVRPDQLKLARIGGEADEVLSKPWDRTKLAQVMQRPKPPASESDDESGQLHKPRPGR